MRIAAAVALLAGGGLAVGALDLRGRGGAASARVVDEVAVTATHRIAGSSNNSPVIMGDPSEPRFVVMANRLDAPDFGCALQVSGDGGRTWTTANPVAELPEGAEKCYAPEVAFDRNGVLHYLFVGLAGRGNEPVGAFLSTSADRGRTFTRPRQVLGDFKFAVRMAIDPDLGDAGRIHLVWIDASSDPPLGGFPPPPNPILAAHSDDGGRTFSDPVQVSAADRERVVAPALALGPDHAVHAAYYDIGRDAIDYQGLEGPVWGEAWSLVLSSSFDEGRTFTPGRVIDGGILPAERVMLIFTMPPPALVAGPGGLVCAAWTDARRGDADALVRCSRDRGRRWDAFRRLNDDAVGNGAWQYLPRLSFSGRRLDAVFLDRRDDPHNVANHVYLTYSTDAGGTFAPNRKISAQPSDTRIGAQYAHASARGQHEIGARLGLLSHGARAVVAWPDTRHSDRDGTGQDLFAATVTLPDDPDHGWPPRVLGAILAAAAIFVLARPRGRRRLAAPGQ